jgi:AcrR family transcriptional regulator
VSNNAPPIWARPEPGARRPRYSREQIASAALVIADREGFEAVSMRRVAAELGAGTMTLYHYVKTKDELVDLMDDAIMAQVVVPEGELSSNWREALTAIAIRSRNAFLQHPWALEGMRAARIGPNGMRHFEQTLLAVSSLELDLQAKLELAAVVDDYVFGHVFRAGMEAMQDRDELRETMLPYLDAQLATGNFPEIERLFAGHDASSGIEVMHEAMQAEGRFERGLEQLLDGLEAGLEARRP